MKHTKEADGKILSRTGMKDLGKHLGGLTNHVQNAAIVNLLCSLIWC